MAVIGREKEESVLKQIVSSHKAEFTAVYGRRRVGKTFLVTESFKHSPHVFLYASGIKDGSKEQQLENFTQALFECFGLDLSLPGFVFKSWPEAFKQLTQLINGLPKNKKIIIFLDELPWLATKRSRLIQTIDYYWNRYWSHDKRIKLIACGSAASWMLSTLINAKGGLHNRVTHSLKIEPFDLRTTKQYLKQLGLNYQNSQVLELYFAFGGIPYYLNFMKKGLSPTQNIEQACFAQHSDLRGEFDRLFKSLFESYQAHEEIVRVLAKNHYGISRGILAEKLRLSNDGGRLTKRLNELEESGFIRSFLSEHSEKGMYYKLIDEYSLFYLSWIEKTKRGRLVKNYWQTQINTGAYHAWSGYAFEAVCDKHLNQICKALNISDGSMGYSWRYTAPKKSNETGCQIDLLFNRPDNLITICEIKFNGAPFIIDKSYAMNLQNKREIYQKQTKASKAIEIAFITNNGLKKTMYSEELVANVMKLDDFFVKLN